MKVSEPTPSKTVSLVVPVWMWTEYQDLAEKRDQNVSEIMRDALAAYIAPVRVNAPAQAEKGETK